MARPPKEKNTEYKAPADTSLFSEDELKRLEQEALQEFEEETKSAAAESFKEETKKKQRQKALFQSGKSAEGDEIESITVDLAPNASAITLDGRLFYHGVTYNFTRAQASTVKEIMFRTWQHEREVGGANINATGRGFGVSNPNPNNLIRY